MKKYFLIFAFIALTPSIASAAWWNPLSWGIFSPPNISVQVQSTSTANTTENTPPVHFPTVSTTTIITASTSTVASSTHFVAIHKNIVKKYVPIFIPATTSLARVNNQTATATLSMPVTPSPCTQGYVYSMGVGCTLSSGVSATSSSSIFNGQIYSSPEQAAVAAKNAAAANFSASTTPDYAAGQGYSGGTPVTDPCDSAMYSSSPNCAVPVILPGLQSSTPSPYCSQLLDQAQYEASEMYGVNFVPQSVISSFQKEITEYCPAGYTPNFGAGDP